MSIVQARNYGRCGNVCFQVGAAISYALKHNIDFSVQNYTNDVFWNPLYFQGLVNPKWEQGREDILINEESFRYKPIPFDESWRGKQIVLNGYFQSWKFLEPYRHEILYLLGIPYQKKDGYVSVHIRRGDFLRYPDKHPLVSDNWYLEQMDKFKGYKFKFYSDDIPYCVEKFGHRNDVEFSYGDEMTDLSDASSCEHNICSSSTFGYFIAWLNRNKNKQCIFPKLWFVEGYSLDTTDLLHPDFIKA